MLLPLLLLPVLRWLYLAGWALCTTRCIAGRWWVRRQRSTSAGSGARVYALHRGHRILLDAPIAAAAIAVAVAAAAGAWFCAVPTSTCKSLPIMHQLLELRSEQCQPQRVRCSSTSTACARHVADACEGQGWRWDRGDVV